MDFRTAYHWTIYDARLAVWHTAVNRIAGSVLVPRVVRHVLYRVAGLDVLAPNVAPGVYFDSPHVHVARLSFINHGCRFFCSHSTVHIGTRVQVAMDVTFITETHPTGGPEQRCRSEMASQPIRVGDGCWIGAKSLVLPGVTIGNGCIIAAGSVVVRSCEPNGLYAGVPARRVRNLPVDSAMPTDVTLTGVVVVGSDLSL